MSAEQQAAEAVDTEDQGVADQFAAADDAADPNDAPAPPSLEELASEHGWMPEDKFKGPKEKWKSAAEFIREGKNIQDRTSRELKRVNDTLDTITRTQGAIMADKLREQHEALSRRYAAAVENGDPDAAWKVANEIRDLQTTAAAPAKVAPAPETEAWVERNQKIKADPVAWNRALSVCDAYARAYPNASVQDQLAYTESNMRREYPHLFDDKAPAQVNGNISRNSSSAPKGRTAADLPREARTIGQDLVDRKLIPSIEAYAKHYFENAAKGQ